MAKYVVWEARRQRWVFQIRVPVSARTALDGRTHVRIHLGNLPERQAVVQAGRLASQYRAQFKQLRPAKTPEPRPLPKAVEHFHIDGERIGKRLTATWLMGAARQFEARLSEVRRGDDAQWDQLQQEIEVILQAVRQDARYLNPAPLREAIAAQEKCLKIRIDTPENGLEGHVEHFNVARVRFLQDCLDIMRQSDRPVQDLYPASDEQLPLCELWGDPADRLLSHWEAHHRSVGQPVNVKTRKKYQGITRDLAVILGRRPLQVLDNNDVALLKTLWVQQKNCSNTVREKLHILQSLLRLLDPAGELARVVQQAIPGRGEPKAARLPYTRQQLVAFLSSLPTETARDRDDRMLVLLLLLLCARLGEVYQLQAGDFMPTQQGWIVRIADYRQTGTGETRLKNGASARRIPLHSQQFPELEAWLQNQIRQGGDLFPNRNPAAAGGGSQAASKRLNRCLRKQFPNERRLVLQSTRNTVSQVMRRAGVDPRIRQRFLGHADQGIHDRHYDPGEFLDAEDMETGAVALASFLVDVLQPRTGTDEDSL